MSEQPVDLRSTWAVLRRHSAVLLVAAVLGAAAGVGLLVLLPPPFTSASVVLLPAASQSGSGRIGGYDAETQVLVVTSSEVLSRAAGRTAPALTPTEVGERVSVDAPASAVLRITASGPTGAEAEGLAAAVANSLVEYLEETRGNLRAAVRAELQERLDTLQTSLDAVSVEIGRTNERIAQQATSTGARSDDASALATLTAVRASTVLDIESLKKQLGGDEGTDGASAAASVIQPASPGARSGYLTDVLLRVLGGAAAVVALTAGVYVLTNKRDPKLRSRDEIGDAVGIPVVASLRARPPRSAGAWLDLLGAYDPDSADGWALRRLLHGLMADAPKDRLPGEPVVLVVVSVGGDSGGLAIGPQIASFAASTGVPTELVAAQQHPSARTLWAACSQGSRHEELPTHLSLTTASRASAAVELSVRLVVLDRETPAPEAGQPVGSRALLAVSPASATRRSLADVVISVDRVGLQVEGIVVANADPLDRTTGHSGPLGAPGEPQRPMRITARSATARSAGVIRRVPDSGRQQ
ncbi:hypothetical protein ACOCJ4_03725 [Knoellia sp. CPCC 206435]|uniref:hypothetical protein n=1 Tax=Knoellia terrae TaxID=3404797 RepID=UPI003B438E68